MTVEAEEVTVKVGNITIETPPGKGPVASVFDTQVLFDGKPAPLDISRIELVADVENGLWRVSLVKLTGFVQNDTSWRERKPLL